MNVYNFDEIGVLVSITEAYLDPLESAKTGEAVYLLPANATFTPIPEEILEYPHKYQFVNGAWEVVIDYRGTIVYDEFGTEKMIKELGPIPEGYSLTYEISNVAHNP